MLMRIGAISSLLLVFAISACGLFAKYELEIKEATKTSVKVDVKKKGESAKLKTGDDGADLEVTLTVTCGDDEKEYTEAATDGTASFKVDDFVGEKSDCEAKATADDAKSAEKKLA